MFEHSVKVPRHYKVAANIVKKVSEEGGSVKTLLYDNKLKHFRTSVLYALINETVKHAIDIQKMFENTGILVNEPRLDPWLAKVLAAELIYGKKSLPGNSKPEQTILAYKERFEKSKPEENLKTEVRRPRYVRVNTNLLTTSDAIRAFQDEGYKFIRCTSGSYNDYLQQIQNLTEYDFTQDYHVKTMFVFAPGTKLHEHDLYLEHKIILQDKATALAVHLLAPPPGSVVLDMCAAPGMKTSQLAAYLRNQGKIYAVERNENRYETLRQNVEATESKCVQTFLKDALEIKRGDLDDVEYILLDPSCSGSGMELSVHNYIEESRLAKLTSLQEKFLKHAMNSFPNAKRIVYSTCSIFPEENERVVTNIVKASRAKWRVKDVKELLKDQWNNYGSGMYGSIGTRCLYARSDTDFTTGFFVAVLERDLNDQDINKISDEPIKKVKNEQHIDVNNVKTNHYETEVNNYFKGKEQSTNDGKKKKHTELNAEKCTTEYITNLQQSDDIIIEQDEPKIKKSKRHDKEYSDRKISICAKVSDVFEEGQETPKKNKKKRKDRENKESLNETVNISSDIEKTCSENFKLLDNTNNLDKQKKKSKKQKEFKGEFTEVERTLNESSLTEEIEKEQLKYTDIETLKVSKSLEGNNNNRESVKPKKKKHKSTDDTIEVRDDTLVPDVSENKTGDKKSKKKKKERNLSPDVSICDTTHYISECNSVKTKNCTKDDTEIDECQIPKKKKKKRVIELS